MHKVGLRACFGGLYASENHKNDPEGILKTKKSDKKTRQSTYLDEYMLFKKSHQKYYVSRKLQVIFGRCLFFSVFSRYSCDQVIRNSELSI